jgi:hypothetical protein
MLQMKPLAKDTIYYRHDHPNGFMFAKGATVPTDGGWSAAVADIEPAPAKTYECTTFDAYEGLLASERLSSGLRAETLNKVSAYVGQLRAEYAALNDEATELRGEVESLKAALAAATAARS